ncbi:MAG: diguanylate cyclase [Solirubrobacterales bacterium]|nr:diguanylate cyclase [Solirubrobacterales bacterium]
MDEEQVGKPGGARDSEGLSNLLVAPTAILESLPDAVVAADHDGRIVYVNALAEALFGYPRSELLGQPVQTLWPARVRERYVRNMELYFATEHPLRFSTAAWGLRRDGSEFIGEMSWGILETTGGPILLAVGRDVSERRAAEARLRAVAAIGERALSGADPADLAGQAIALLRTLLPIGAAELRMADGSALAASGPATRSGANRLEGAAPEVHLAVGNGDELLLSPTRPLDQEELSFARAVANTLATALARLRSEERTRYEALHDPLTGLANRTLLRDRLHHALARREHGATAALFVDLDNFKQVNDSHGHATGDAVLVEVARRLHTAVRPGDTIARFGGDEFVAVCEGIDAEAALAVGQRLHDALQMPLSAGGAEHQLSASIGIALGETDPDALLADADAAAYRAKAAGRGRIELFG